MINGVAVPSEYRDIEEMVRVAGGYLEVSADLRPRTLEGARDESRETSTRFCISILAVAILFLAVSAGMFRGDLSNSSPLKSSVSANCDQLYAIAQRKAAQANVDPSWSLVDAYCELRLRQSSLIEDAF